MGLKEVMAAMLRNTQQLNSQQQPDNTAGETAAASAARPAGAAAATTAAASDVQPAAAAPPGIFSQEPPTAGFSQLLGSSQPAPDCAAGSGRPSGGMSLQQRMAATKAQQEASRQFASQQAALCVAAPFEPSQHTGASFRVGGRRIVCEDGGLATQAAAAAAAAGGGGGYQQHPTSQLVGAQALQQQRQQQQQERQREHDGIDRQSARAAVVLGADVDDFEFDASEALRQQLGSRKGKEAAENLPLGGDQQKLRDEDADDGLPGTSQLAATQKSAQRRKAGQRGGKAATPGGTARRGGGGGAAGGSNGQPGQAKRARARKPAQPKRRREEAEEPQEEEDEQADKEQRDADGGLIDLLLLPPEALQQTQGAAAAAAADPLEPAKQLPGTQAPAAAILTVAVPAVATAGAAAHNLQQQQEVLPSPQAAAMQQQQQQAAAPRANAPTDGPNEDLVLVVDENGAPLPLELEAEAYLMLVVPAPINRYLRDYQRQGVEFLMRQYARGTGGVLADDMGLGKTVQTIAFVAALLGKTGGPEDAHSPEMKPLELVEPPDSGADLLEDCYAPDYTLGWPILVVAPTSVLRNWEREFETWGIFRTVICHGKQRELALMGIKGGTKEIMILSYGMLRQLEEEIATIPWHCVIFDEAHTLKNSATQVYQAANRLPTRLRYGLTGTPFQNDYAEIFCVMDFVAPGCLSAKNEFMKNIAVPMMRGQKSTSTDFQKADGVEAQQQLRATLAQYMVRRTKGLIAHQLPKKVDSVVFCELSPLQLAAYKRVLDSPDLELIRNYSQPCTQCNSGEPYFECCGWKVEHDQGGVLWPMYHLCECDNPYDANTNPKGCKSHKADGCWRHTKFGFRRMCPFCMVLPCCNILRKISNHLELCKAHHEDQVLDPPKFERDREVAQLVIGSDEGRLGGYVTTEDFLRLSDTSTCGKMQALENLLGLWSSQGGGNKVLLFSSSVKLLRILEKLVISKGYDHLMLDGSVPQQDRQVMVDSFNKQPSTFIFLISTLAGGTGLNLTAANKVVIFDPSWNPASDLQAQDRAFRIGQQRDVSVYRFIAAGTLEEMVYSRQLYKQQQSEMVLEGKAQPRYFEGAKTGMKEDRGELWGLLNLIKLNAEKIQTMDLIEQQRRRQQAGQQQQQQQQYRIEEYDAESVAAELAAQQQGAGGSGRGGGRPGGTDVAAAEEGSGGVRLPGGVGDDEYDAGLEALVEQELGLLAEEQGAQPRWEAHDEETAVLGQSGIAGILDHGCALRHSGGEAAANAAAGQAAQASRQQQEAALAAAATANAGKRPKTERSKKATAKAAAAAGGDGGGSSSGRVVTAELPLLESLAELLGVPLEAAARQLLAMTAQERQELRLQFASQDEC